MKIESKRDVVLCIAEMLTTIGTDVEEGAEINWESEAEQIIEFVIENADLISTREERKENAAN
jgi:hypothetical protein